MKVEAAANGKQERVKYFLEQEKIDPNIPQPDLVIQAFLLSSKLPGSIFLLSFFPPFLAKLDSIVESLPTWTFGHCQATSRKWG